VVESQTRMESPSPSSNRLSLSPSSPASSGGLTPSGRDSDEIGRFDPVDFSRRVVAHPSLGSSNTEPISKLRPRQLTRKLGNMQTALENSPGADARRRHESLSTSYSVINSGPYSLERPHTTPELLSMRQRRFLKEDDRDLIPRRCVNFRDTHEKGHQYPANFYRPSLLSMRLGSFVSSFSAEETSNKITANLATVLKSSNLKGALHVAAASTKLDKLHTNTTCLVCFRRMPIHTLPCKHSFCGTCIRRLGTEADALDSHIATLEGCPLHINEDPQTLVFKF